jgi:S-adenosyl-L-methionine hydrolase (adenosine-forming)
MKPCFVLLTDFGLQDAYVGQLKAVLLSRCPEAQIIDLSHGILPQNVVQAALILKTSYKYFPKHSIFICIVDPGVGTSRKIILVDSGNYTFLAPDNGLLSGVLDTEKTYSLYQIVNPSKKTLVSSTFHGRDILAPAATAFAQDRGRFLKTLKRLSSIEPLKFPRVKRTKNQMAGEIIYFDHYGNAISNISRDFLREKEWRDKKVYINGKKIMWCETYGLAKSSVIALWNSSALLEVAVPSGSAKEKQRLKIGDEVFIR